jgi:hypothetical protein
MLLNVAMSHTRTHLWSLTGDSPDTHRSLTGDNIQTPGGGFHELKACGSPGLERPQVRCLL